MQAAPEHGSAQQLASCREAVHVSLAQLRDLLLQLRRAQNLSTIEVELSAVEVALDELAATLDRLDTRRGEQRHR